MGAGGDLVPDAFEVCRHRTFLTLRLHSENSSSPRILGRRGEYTVGSGSV